MDLLALTDFDLVARHGGFGRAARAEGRPKATLSRRVAELEASLGVRLFERGARTSKLTEEGRALHERTAALLSELNAVAEDIASGSDRPRGTLRISAPVLFAQSAMGRIAAGFFLSHPEVRVEVTAEDRAVDLVEERYDLVIRVNPRTEQDLIGRCFLRDRQIVVATPALVRPAAGTPVPAILLRSAAVSAPWLVAHGEGPPRPIVPDPMLRLSSLIMVRDAVRAGAGAALLPLSLVSADLKSGRLASWGEAEGMPVEIWALHTSRRLLSSRVSAFLQYLAAAFPNGSPEDLAAFIAG